MKCIGESYLLSLKRRSFKMEEEEEAEGCWSWVSAEGVGGMMINGGMRQAL